MFQSQSNRHISSRSKSFVPAGPKCDVFREGCDKKRHKLKEPRTQVPARFSKPGLLIFTFVPSSRKVVTFLEVLKNLFQSLAASHRTWNVTFCSENMTSHLFVTVPHSNAGPGSGKISAKNILAARPKVTPCCRAPVKVEGENLATPGDYLRSVDTRTPRDRIDSPISG